MRVLIKAYPPYDKVLGGREKEVDLPEGATIRDLVRLVNANEYFTDLTEAQTNEDMYRAVMPQRGNALLSLDDRLFDGDRITIFPPIRGG